MANPASDTVPDPAYKTPVDTMSIVIGTIFGTLFVAFALVDFSVLEFGSESFTAQYLMWKSQAPYVKHVVTFLTLIVPLAVMEITMNLVHLATKKATAVRHLCDFIHFVSFILVIYTGVVGVAPTESAILEHILNEDIEDALAVIPQLYQPYIANLGLNVIMLLLPIIKLGNQLANPVPMIPRPVETTTAAETVTEQKEKTKKD